MIVLQESKYITIMQISDRTVVAGNVKHLQENERLLRSPYKGGNIYPWTLVRGSTILRFAFYEESSR